MDIENPADFRDEGCIDVEILLQFRGQTGRFRKVVSHGAVSDGNLHGFILGSFYGDTSRIQKIKNLKPSIAAIPQSREKPTWFLYASVPHL